VDIAESLNWDLQKLTFFDYIEHFLNKAVVSEDDKVFNKLVNSLGHDDTAKVTDVINRIACNTHNSNDNENYPYTTSTTKDKYGNGSSKENDACSLIKNFNKMNMKDNGCTEMKFLNNSIKENVLIFFENYVDLISETLQKSYSI